MINRKERVVRTDKSLLLTIFFAILVFSSQGCDQVSKLTDHFFPKKTATAPKAPVPMEVKAVAAVTPAPVIVKSEAPAKPEETKPAPAKPVEAKPEQVMAPAPAAAELPPNVLAKIGDWSITLDELKKQEKAAQDMVAQQNNPNVKYNLPTAQLLDMIVEQQLLYREALRQGMDKDPKISQQLTEARKLILSQNLQNQLVKDINVTDEEITNFYNDNNNKPLFYEPTEYKFSQIVVDTEDQAKTILGQLTQGGNFTEIANSQSKIKPDGNYLTEDKLSFDKLKDVLKALDVGTFSTTFKGPDGFYIIKLEDKKGGKVKELTDEVKKGIKDAVSYSKYLESIRKVGLDNGLQFNTNLRNILEAK